MAGRMVRTSDGDPPRVVVGMVCLASRVSGTMIGICRHRRQLEPRLRHQMCCKHHRVIMRKGLGVKRELSPHTTAFPHVLKGIDTCSSSTSSITYRCCRDDLRVISSIDEILMRVKCGQTRVRSKMLEGGHESGERCRASAMPKAGRRQRQGRHARPDWLFSTVGGDTWR